MGIIPTVQRELYKGGKWIYCMHCINYYRYEDLRADTFSEVKIILKFLNVTFQENNVKTKLKEDFTTFKRYVALHAAIEKIIVNIEITIPWL